MARITQTVAQAASSEPLEIEINGVTADGKPFEPKVFACLPHVNTTAIVDLLRTTIASSETENTTGAVLAIGEMIDFLQACVVDSQRKEFSKLLHSNEFQITTEFLANLFQEVVVFYSNRPTAQPSTSADGSLITGAISTGASQQAVYVNSETMNSQPTYQQFTH